MEVASPAKAETSEIAADQLAADAKHPAKPDAAPMSATAIAATKVAASLAQSATSQATAVQPENPPEDLELRGRLEAFTKEKGVSSAMNPLSSTAKILRRLQEEPANTKLHSMRRDVIERAIGEELLFSFEAAGFTEQERVAPAAETGEPGAVSMSLVWRATEPEALERLRVVVYEVQRAADLCLDPDTVSFAQVSELVQAGRTLPGIEDVDDTVPQPRPPKSGESERPKKPWEK